MTAEAHSEAAGLGDTVGDNDRADLVHLHATVLFRNVNRSQAELAGLLDQLARDRPLFMLDLLYIWEDLVFSKLFRGLRDLTVFFGEVLGSEDFVGTPVFNEKAAA